MPRSPLLVLSSALLLAACATSTSPQPEDVPFVVAPVHGPGAPAGATNPPTVRVRDGGLEVLGIISTPSPCHDIDAELRRDARTLAIVVSARDDGSEACIAVLGEFAYAVDVDDLEAGAWRVVVTHAIPGTGWPTTTVLDAEVEVP